MPHRILIHNDMLIKVLHPLYSSSCQLHLCLVVDTPIKSLGNHLVVAMVAQELLSLTAEQHPVRAGAWCVRLWPAFYCFTRTSV